MLHRCPGISLAVVLVLVSIAGCGAPAPARRGGGGGDSGERRQPSEDELRHLMRLAEVVAVGRIDARREEPRGVSYEVRLVDLVQAPAALSVTHPAIEDRSVQVGTFLFREGRAPGEIGDLRPQRRYLFFLAPTERAGEWLNLDDPAAYPLPASDDVLERLRELAGPR